MDTRLGTPLISFCTVQLRTLRRSLFGNTLSLYDLWSRPYGVARLLGLMVSRHAPIPRKGSGNNNNNNKIGFIDFLIFSGLLTVDRQARLKIGDLLENPWVKGACVPTTPLLSPKVLSPGPRLPTSFNVTMKAYHMAAKEGFQLAAVTNAPLAQRRQHKKRARKRSTSTSSDTRSSSGSTGSVLITSAGTSVTSTCSTPTTPTVENCAEVVVDYPTTPCENVEVVSSPVAKQPRLSLSEDSTELPGSSLRGAWPSVNQHPIVVFDDSLLASKCTALTNSREWCEVSKQTAADKSSATVSRQLSSAESGYSTNTCESGSPLLNIDKPGSSIQVDCTERR